MLINKSMAAHGSDLRHCALLTGRPAGRDGARIDRAVYIYTYTGGESPPHHVSTYLLEEEMSRLTRVKRSQSTRLPHDFDDREDIFLCGMEPGRATTLGGARGAPGAAGTTDAVSSQRRIHTGMLQKRCRVSQLCHS